MVQQFCDTDSLRHLAGLLQGAAEKNKEDLKQRRVRLGVVQQLENKF